MSRPLNVLVGCEFSGVVRDAFRQRGHNAWSCDLLDSIPCENGDFHFQGDIRWWLDKAWQRGPVGWVWDLAIFHPPCTYLTIAAEWAYKDDPGKKMNPGVLFGAERRQARQEALAFVDELWNCGIPRICIENPVGVIPKGLPHLPKPQWVQPYEFGEDASKKTGLWLKNLPPLVKDPANYVQPRTVNGRPRWGNQTDSGQNRLGPSEDRWALRSITPVGIAKAMAEQWGCLPPLEHEG